MTAVALVIIDVQNDFVPGGALAVPQGDEVLDVANRVSPLFDLVVATQDWHPPDHVSFAENHTGCSPGDVIDAGGYEQILWPVHCVQGTPGAAICSSLDTRRIARVFYKGAQRSSDSYSAFFDNAHRRATGLDEFLRAADVREVFLLGLATDYCVAYTARDALQLGYAVTIIVDGCRGIDARPGDSAAALEDLCRRGVRLLESNQLPAALNRSPA